MNLSLPWNWGLYSLFCRHILQFVLSSHFTVCSVFTFYSLFCLHILQFVLSSHFPVCSVFTFSSLFCLHIFQFVLSSHFTACSVFTFCSLFCLHTFQFVLSSHFIACSVFTFYSLFCPHILQFMSSHFTVSSVFKFYSLFCLHILQFSFTVALPSLFIVHLFWHYVFHLKTWTSFQSIYRVSLFNLYIGCYFSFLNDNRRPDALVTFYSTFLKFIIAAIICLATIIDC